MSLPRNLDGAYTLLLFLVPFMAGICVANLWPLPGALMWWAAAVWLLLVIYTFYYIKYNRCSFRCFPSKKPECRAERNPQICSDAH